MKKESDNRIEMSRRGFLKAAALTGAAICVSPALEKVQAAERAVSGKSSVKDIPAGMAAVRKQRTLGSGQHVLPDVGLEQCGGGGTDV